jgi:hypothetical protein
MRKILLASTALVALTSVSAMAADVSISGSSEIVLDMGDSATADQSSFATEHDIAINFTNTSDSGITTSMSYGMDDNDNTADDLVVSISGDFGTISYTGVGARDDHALTAVDNEASGTAEENTGTLPTGTYTGSLPALGTALTYKLPSIVDGLGIAASFENDSGGDDAASFAVTYAAGPLSLVYGEVRDHARTDTHVGATISVAGATLMIAKNSDDGQREATLMGATYAVSPELTLGIEMDKGENGTASQDFSMTAVGATYQIATGLSASFTSTETDSGTDANDSNYTSIGLHVAW